VFDYNFNYRLPDRYFKRKDDRHRPAYRGRMPNQPLPVRTILPPNRPLVRPRAILFDMDGTLTRPMLDFDAIRAEIGISGPILEAMRKMDENRLTQARAILDRHEREAAEGSELNDGCRELLAEIAARGLPTAIITRNSRGSVDIVLARHKLKFDALICRDAAPPKPDPRALLVACEAIGVDARETWMIGDGYHDIEAGNAAGAATIWLSHGEARDFEAAPTVTVRALSEVRDLLPSGVA
jgi:HAD superfamily hydrolase (TIGR01509 family)